MAFYYNLPDPAWRPAQDAGCAGCLKNLHFAGCIWQTSLSEPLPKKCICQFQESTSKGSYCSWKKIVKVWMMMMKEGIFAGHPSLALPHLALLAHTLLAFAPLTLTPLALVNWV